MELINLFKHKLVGKHKELAGTDGELSHDVQSLLDLNAAISFDDVDALKDLLATTKLDDRRRKEALRALLIRITAGAPSKKLLDVLVSHGVGLDFVDEEQETLLFVCVRRHGELMGAPDLQVEMQSVMDQLIEQGCDVNHRNISGEDVASIAYGNKDLKCLEYLVIKGATLQLLRDAEVEFLFKTSHSLKLVLHFSDKARLLSFASSKKENMLFMYTRELQVPIHTGKFKADVMRVLDELIIAGCDVNERNEDDTSVAHLAVDMKNNNLLRFFITRGFDVSDSFIEYATSRFKDYGPIDVTNSYLTITNMFDLLFEHQTVPMTFPALWLYVQQWGVVQKRYDLAAIPIRHGADIVNRCVMTSNNGYTSILHQLCHNTSLKNIPRNFITCLLMLGDKVPLESLNLLTGDDLSTFAAWLHLRISVHSLKELSRVAVRRYTQRSLYNSIEQYHLPRVLEDYLMLKEFSFQ